jgi:hypothetical protein
VGVHVLNMRLGHPEGNMSACFFLRPFCNQGLIEIEIV